MSFDPFHIDLPVKEIIPLVRKHLATNSTLIVNAPPGAGKSTLLPLAIYKEDWLSGKKVIMLEPRRLATKTIALRMALLLGEEIGQSVGYRIRFETCVSEATRIEVVTEGILTRMIHSDPTLEGVGMVIFDEFHERSIHADVAMALAREAQQTLRPDLRIMIMSATLNMPQLKELLKAPVAESKGKQYPVEIVYTGGNDVIMLPEMTARTIQKAVQEHKGDVLAFLPGQGEIKKCEKILRNALRQFVIHPLYGQLPPSKQYAAIMPDRNGRRKIVLATSIAQTSLTIEGISIVVDSGFGRISRFDPRSGLSRLETVRIARDAADQRAGRAGRLSPGTCFRMWPQSEQEKMAEFSTPEILEADLCNLVLDMAQRGIVNISQMTWLTPPPPPALAEAAETLNQLQALENGRITEHGKKMHALPCHPRIAHMLLMAGDGMRLALATDIAALLEERDPLTKEAGIDINLRLEALRRFRRERGQAKPWKKIEKIAAAYRKLFGIAPDNETVDPYETGVLLAHAYPERIAFARPGNNAQFQMANGKYASASRQGMGKIFMASPLNPKDLVPLVKEREVITWDTEDGELTATKDLRIGSIVLRSKPLPKPDERYRAKAISDAIKRDGASLLPFTEEVQQWQQKILELRASDPQAGWPDVSTQTLLMTNAEWLLSFLQQVETPEDLLALDLLSILERFLDGEKKLILKTAL
jgi:ATP-dependent helicase HrpB